MPGSGLAARAAVGADDQGHSMKLRLEDVTKSYAGAVAVDGLSLTVGEGDFMTLLGPSGSGKTTTLMIVAGFVPPDTGRVYLDGRDVTRLPAFKRGIGVVFQNYALFPHLTVFDNVAFPLRMRSRPSAEIRTRVDQVLALVGLPQAGSRYPRQLSGGQQQRVALARAIVFRPPLLLMDEPLGALDRKLREQMQLEIKRIQKELKITVVYVTHDQEEALVMSDRIALMRNGRIEQCGSARRLYDEPASEFAANFIGESNVFRGRVIGRAEGLLHIAAENLRLKARMPGGDRDVAGVTVVVRPEKIRLAEDGERVRENACEGRIVETLYLGESTKYRVRVDRLGELTVRSQNSGAGDRYANGDVVRVTWSADDTIVFADDARG